MVGHEAGDDETDPRQAATFDWDANANLISISLQDASVPEILETAPAKGKPGTRVKITGVGFSATASENTVRFDGTEAQVVDASETALIVVAPTGADDGAISVVAPGGTATSQEPFDFGDSGEPSINSVSPSVVDNGSAVTLHVDNPAPARADNIVRVNGRRAEVVDVDSNSVDIVAPPGIISGEVQLSTPDGADTDGPILYIPPPHEESFIDASGVDDTGRLVLGDTKQISLATSSERSLYVFKGHAGQDISMGVANSSLSPGTANIYTPDGHHLNGATASTGAFMESTRLPVDGDYTVMIGGGAGTAELTVYDLGSNVQDAEPSTSGDEVSIETSIPGENGDVHLTLQPGDQVSAVASNSTYDHVNLKWVKPDGTTYAAGDTITSSSGFLDQLTAPTGGRWTLRVDPQGQETGAIDLKVYDATDVAGDANPSSSGDQIDAQTSIPGQNARYEFDGSEGQRIAAKILSSNLDPWASIKILKPEGSGTISLGNSAGSWSEPATLPADGTYTLLIDPHGPGDGNASLKLFEVPEDLQEEVTPTISGDEITVNLDSPGQSAVISVPGVTDHGVSVQLTDSSISSFATTWNRPDNSQLGYYQPFGTGSAFRDAVRFDTSGTHKFIVDPTGDATGSVTLKFYDATDTTTSSSLSGSGTSLSVGSTVPGANQRITFEGEAGQRFAAQQISTTVGYGSVQLFDPGGSPIGYGSVSDGGLTLMRPTTLPADGTYTLLIDPWQYYTGTTSLKLYSVADDPVESVTPTTAGDSASLDLGFGQIGHIHASVAAGDRYSVKSTGSTFNFLGYWNSPSDSWGSYNWFAPGTGFLDQYAFGSSGQWDFRVQPQYPDAAGSTTITVYDTPDVVEHVDSTPTGDTAAVTIGTPGQNARVTVDADAGDEIRVHPYPSTIAYGYITGFRPGGSQFSFSGFTSSGDPGTLTLTAPDDGTYTFLVDPVAMNTGDIDVEIQVDNGSAFRVVSPGKEKITKQLHKRPPFRTLKSYKHGRAHPRPAIKKPSARQTRILKLSRYDSLHDYARNVRSIDRERLKQRAADGRKTDSKRYRQDRKELAPALRQESVENPAWRPRREDRVNGWNTDYNPSPWTTLGPRAGGIGETAISGQVLGLDGDPVPGVEVTADGSRTTAKSDGTGRFVLPEVKPGKRVVRVVGSAADDGKIKYGDYEIQVNAIKAQTTPMDNIVWLARLSPAGEKKVPDGGGAIKLTNPDMPGFEVRVPAGSKITDKDGKTVKHLNLSPVPLDRPSFGLPAGVTVSSYFTVQPGGAYFSKGAQIVYPNYSKLAPGQRVDFWDYDAKDRGWFKYGKGKVTKNGKQIVPDKSVRVWKLSGAMAATNPPPPEDGAGKGPMGADPVDLSTGLFVYKKSDLSIGGATPFTLTRTYRPKDSFAYQFGKGFTTVLDYRLSIPDNDHPYEEINLVTPEGDQIKFTRTSPGTDRTGAELKAQATPGEWLNAEMVYGEDATWRIKRTDGSTYEFYGGLPVSAIVDRTGNRIEITRVRGTINQATQVTLPDGRWIRFKFGINARVSEAYDSAGRRTHYEYNSAYQMSSSTDANGHETDYEYDSSGRMTGVTDGRGIKYVENEYDSNGRVENQTLADGGTYHFEYFAPYRPPEYIYPTVVHTTVTDPRGSKNDYFFDWSGNLGSGNIALGTSHELQYWYERDEDTGRVNTVHEAGGGSTDYEYADNGDIESVTRHINGSTSATTEFTYDANHNVTSVTDPQDKTTTYEYDAQNRVTSVTDPTDRTTSYGYDTDGSSPTSVTDPDGKTTVVERNDGDISAVIDPLGHKTRVFTDAAGRTSKVTDALGRDTRVRYDDANNVLSVRNPKGETTSYDYDNNGNLTQVTDPRNNTLSAEYDDMDRIASYTDQKDNETTLQRDLNGNVTKVIDRRGLTTTATYDDLNRPTFVGYGAFGDPEDPDYASSKTLAYDDDTGQLDSVDDSETGQTTFEQNLLGQITSVSSDDSQVDYDYDLRGLTTGVDVDGGPSTDYDYDDAGRMTAVHEGDVDVSLGYDAAGRRSSVGLPGDITQKDSYDAASRLVKREFLDGDDNPIGALEYGYDATNRRVASWGAWDPAVLPQAVSTGTYDEANRLTGRGTTSYTYDDAGNLTGDGTNTYGWNTRGQLASVDGPKDASHTYDVFGRRTDTTRDGDDQSTVFDGWNVAKVSGDVPDRTEVSGQGLDDVFAYDGSGDTQAVLTDAQNSVLATATGADSVSALQKYSPTGVPASTNDAGKAAWTGREDDGNGLQYFRNRYYNPKMGRFISEDPAGLAGGGPNFYSFANGDPINYTDPSGLLGLGTFGIGENGAFSNLSAGLLNGASFGLPNQIFTPNCQNNNNFYKVGNWAGPWVYAGWGGVAVAGRFAAAELAPAAVTAIGGASAGGLHSIYASFAAGRIPPVQEVLANAALGGGLGVAFELPFVVSTSNQAALALGPETVGATASWGASQLFPTDKRKVCGE